MNHLIRWIGWWLVISAVVWIGLVFGLGWETLGGQGRIGMVPIALVVAALTVLPAGFGAQSALIVTGVGLLGGLGYLVYVRQTVAGWGDLAGVFAFLAVFGMAWLGGWVFQAVWAVIRKTHRTKVPK